MTPSYNASHNVRIWWDTSVNAYRMSSPYNAELVNAVKSFIPGSDRSYDAMSKMWTFTERVYDPLTQLFAKLDIRPQVMTRQQVEAQAAASAARAQDSANGVASASSAKPLDAVMIEFVRLLPYDAARTAYRKAATQLHSDVAGGSDSRMSALNVAWQRIEKEVYGQ